MTAPIDLAAVAPVNGNGKDRQAWESGPPEGRFEEERPVAVDRASGVVPAPLLTFTTAEILARPLPPVPFLVPTLAIAPGAPTCWAGYGASKKTIAAQSFALSVASGKLLWGAYTVRQGDVCHLDYEQGLYLDALRYQRLARAMGVDLASLGARLRLAVMPSLYMDDDRAEEALCVATTGAALAIVDSQKAATPSLEENSSDFRRPLDIYTRVSERTGCAFLFLHHARKPAEGAKGDKFSARGSSAIFDATAAFFVFTAEKGEPTVVRHEKNRWTGITVPDFGLEVEDVEIAGDPRGGLRVFHLAQEQLAGRSPVPGAAFAGVTRRVLDFVRQNPGTTGNAAREQLGVKRDTVYAALSELARLGMLENRGSSRAPQLFARSES